MTVKELIEKLEKVKNKDYDVIFRFALSEDDEWGHNLEIVDVGEWNYKKQVDIYGDYKTTKEDCLFVGANYLTEIKNEDLNIECVE